ncbi:hypothetical protein CEXT_702321 [Caerostris extrusa]|uniref:CRAL-TRIO domain-containing protein n=1 Tax=Caerostris extrusa TaxID=172846 RepID=A0AAV4WEG7_CAEEX|nr:hypothetical protein CEXT_702321 [Caerostris extrusa]
MVLENKKYRERNRLEEDSGRFDQGTRRTKNTGKETDWRKTVVDLIGELVEGFKFLMASNRLTSVKGIVNSSELLRERNRLEEDSGRFDQGARNKKHREINRLEEDSGRFDRGLVERFKFLVASKRLTSVKGIVNSSELLREKKTDWRKIGIDLIRGARGRIQISGGIKRLASVKGIVNFLGFSDLLQSRRKRYRPLKDIIITIKKHFIMGIRDPATAKIGEEIFPFEMETVPEYFRKKAEVELLDTPDRRVQEDKHTKNIEFDDDFLLQYLRVRKYNVARAFTQLKALVALKKKYPLIFTNFSYNKTVKATNDKIISILPWRCQDGCAILLVELECIAGRYKEIHLVNQSVTFKAAWFIFKHFLTDKLKKRFVFHNTPETLLNYFPKVVLPKQYGGNLENYDMSSWLKKVMAPKSWHY